MKLKLYGKQGKGKTALVDEDIYGKVSKWKWYVDSKGYPYRERSAPKRIFLHQFILGAYPKDKSEIDHINADKLDNRKSNLRFCTSAENHQNRRRYKNNKSGYLGVFKHSLTNKWVARIYKNKKPIYLGLFSELNEAVRAVKKAKS